MYRLFYLFFLLMIIKVSCQDTNTINLPEDLMKYYELTNKAEQNIINNDKKQASKDYEKAFGIYQKPFSSDLYTSLLINLELKNDGQSFNNYKALKCLDFFSAKLENNPEFRDFYQRNKEKISTISCENKLNLDLKRKLDSLFLEDQNYRRNAHSSGKILTTKEKEEKDSVNAVELENLFKKYGFIGEYEIGAKENSDRLFLNYLMIVLHQQQHDKKKVVNFEPILYKALEEGKLKNKNFIDLLSGMHSKITGYDYFSLYKIDNVCCFVDKDVYLQNITDDTKKNIKNIEEKRAQIGLNSLYDALANKLYCLENPKYKLEAEYQISFLNSNSQFLTVLKDKTIKITFQELMKYLNSKEK